MILLDTNVLSEALRPGPHPHVVGWLDRQQIGNLYLAAPSLAQLLLGVAMLPEGRRKLNLLADLTDLLDAYLGERIVAFDAAAALAFADVVARARAHGRSVCLVDGQIAAIARAGTFTVASRNTAPFRTAGVPVIDPWATA